MTPDIPATTPIVLSICIPTWNRAGRVYAQVSRLLASLPQRTEIVVVDNGSDDGTFSGLQALLHQHPDAPVRLLRNEVNLGADLNYLRALEAGRGEWLWLLGDDDELGSDLHGLISCLDAPTGLLLLNPDPRRFPVWVSVDGFLAADADLLGNNLLKVGHFLIRRRDFHAQLRHAYEQGLGTLHAYGLVTAAIIEKQGQLALIDVPGLFAPTGPDPTATLRWRLLDGQIGAWVASERGLPRHRKAVRLRERRLRQMTIFIILLNTFLLTDARPRWAELRWFCAACGPRMKGFAAALLVLRALPSSAARMITRLLFKVFGKKPLPVTVQETY